MEYDDDQPRPVPPLQRHLQLETDLFCYGCGYNLHGQIVTHDERLGFLICRCPECGRFHPAAMGVSASRPWLARLGVSMIISWILSTLVIVGLISLFIGGMNYAHFENYTIYAQNDYNTMTRYRVVRSLSIDNRNYNDPYWLDRWHYFAFFSAAASILLGMFFAVAMWHVRPARRWLVITWPLLIALLAFLFWNGNENLIAVFRWSVGTSANYALLNVIAMAVGLVIGRPVARAVCKMLIPPKLLQHVQFLWRCDGKLPPAAKVA